jgi:hypothetical protein
LANSRGRPKNKIHPSDPSKHEIVNIVLKLEQVFEAYRMMFKELNEGIESNSLQDVSTRKRKTVKMIKKFLTEGGGRKIIHRFLLFRRVGLGT